MFQAYHFDRVDVALPGMKKFFENASNKKNGHAKRLMEYLNKRGGRIILTDILATEKQEFSTVQDVVAAALKMEKIVNESLLNLHSVASGHMDVDFYHFLKMYYLQEQVDNIDHFAKDVANLIRVGEGLGVVMFDQK